MYADAPATLLKGSRASLSVSGGMALSVGTEAREGETQRQREAPCRHYSLRGKHGVSAFCVLE